MNNQQIADNFSLLSKLMDIHNENSFKSKSYSVAAFTIEKLPVELNALSADKIFSIKGIGESTGKKVIEQIETGELKALTEILAKTPIGIVEMLAIKGIGPKKIATIWHELDIESLGELLYACNENRLTLYKGFGEKTQQNIKENIEFYFAAQGKYLYAGIEHFANTLLQHVQENFVTETFFIVGEFRRQLEIINELAFVTTATIQSLKEYFLALNFDIVEMVDETSTDNYISVKGKENLLIKLYCCNQNNLINTLFKHSCSNTFMEYWQNKFGWNDDENYLSEEAIFDEHNLLFIPSFLRENETIFEKENLADSIKTIIQPNNIKGIIHSHSKWSDGNNTLEEMALAAMQKGLEYLVISDHSKSAFYANGLTEERIAEQHKHIDELNKKLFPFVIFKSIECDILNDGNLDYNNDVLSTFDLVIASVHSNLKMTEEKAMMRLMNAIENRYTSILGHLTGRLLLSRNGYPINHQKVIDACAANNVVIELNAHPRRLDLDWRWIDAALNKNVLISINPDAHSINGFDDCKYGVLVAKKALLQSSQNLSSFGLQEMKMFIEQQHLKRK